MVSNKALPWASPVELFQELQGVLSDLRTLLGLESEDLADQRERERLGEVVNEVGFASVTKPFDQFVDDLADPRLPTGARRHR